MAILAIVIALHVLPAARGRTEDHLDYKFEYYAEENGRIEVETHSAFAEKSLGSKLALQVEYVHDVISGATPTGGPPPPGSAKVPTADMEDVRDAGNIVLDWRFGDHTFSPQFAYSVESDYESFGFSATDAIDFNEKNTTLVLGIAQTLDRIQPLFWSAPRHKDSTDILIGVNQLLSPKTIFTANFTFGYSWGYLADPYKRIRFDDYPDPTAVFPEQRPDHKAREIVYLGLTHFIGELNGSAEASYRFYHDSFGIWSQTVTLAWYQKIGKHVVLSPMFRFYDQTAADFYHVRLPGDPSDPDNPTPIPDSYSADYRLSSMETLTFGIKATVKINEHVGLDAAFNRYEMYGSDGVTPKGQYPKANVFTVGGRIWF